MKHILKVQSLLNLPDTRPLIAMDENKNLKWYGIPEFIDLGLTVKWRNRNIGANTITDYGNYYAWGELETKTYYDWMDPSDSDQNYKYANGDWNKLTKYCNNSEYGNEGYTDELVTLEMMDDVAYQTNNSWRMPTKAECEALIALPNKWMTINNINGRVFCKTNEPGAIKGDFSIMEEGLYLYDENNQNPDSEYGSYNIYDDFDPIGLEYQTKEEVNAKLTTYYAENYGYEGTVNVDTMLFKDAEHQELAVAGTDYQFGSFPEFNQNTMLFIPASGRKYRDSLDGDGSGCYLWSSSLYADNPNNAWYLYFDSDNIRVYDDDRRYGFTVRPVQD